MVGDGARPFPLESFCVISYLANGGSNLDSLRVLDRS